MIVGGFLMMRKESIDQEFAQEASSFSAALYDQACHR